MKGRGSEMLSMGDDSRVYDFHSPENADRWRGLFQQPLRKVLEQTHPSLQAEESALAYVEGLLLRLLSMLCAVPSPLKVQDVEERVERTFPTPIDKWALTDAREAVDRSDKTKKKKTLILPTEKLHQLLQKEVFPYKIDISVTIFMVAILEYICTDILKLAGNYVKKISQKSGLFRITCQDVKTAMYADKVLMDMFYQDEELMQAGSGTPLAPAPSPDTPARRGGRRGSLTYSELVRDLLNDERTFLRDLNMIIRVFKDEIERIYEIDSHTVRLIFANIVDIYEMTVTLLGNLEDAIEMSQDSPTPYIGSCFEDLADTEEFRGYITYASVVTTQSSRDLLQMIADDPELSKPLETAGHGFRLAVKYYLPKLLTAPITHILLYYKYVLDLLQIAPTPEDTENFKQVECHLKPIKTRVLALVRKDGSKLDDTQQISNRERRQATIEKTMELSRLIENWDSKELGQCCNEFIREDTLLKIAPGKRASDRRAYLFDGFLLLCKPIAPSLVNVTGTVGVLGGVVTGGAAGQLKLKEKLHLRKLEVVDRADTDDVKNCIELAQRCGTRLVLVCGSSADKRSWMADLVMLNTKSMLDRTLDSILLDLEKKHPLKLPSPEIYKFAVPDSPENIVFENEKKENNTETPQIKGATLLKLVERLTYHVYADLKLMRTFLTTYRTFCEPAQLLDLLIQRFNIPEPSVVYDTPETIDGVIVTDTEKLTKNTAREDWKRYRKEFLQPVKFRVINVLRHWVDQHFYDFERDPELLDKLKTFLESVDGKPMRKWVESVLKTVQRKTQPPAEGSAAPGPVQHVFDRAPPPPERHVAELPERHDWHPLALHPLETARQLTLLEFDLYRKVKTWELVGAVWTKKDKAETSPNLMRLIKLSTNFTRWLEKSILECENLEERVYTLRWVMELAGALMTLNNFDGVLSCMAALGSAAVYRLRATFQRLSVRLARAFAEYNELSQDHFSKYKERLKSINPPCVPFCGISLTEILHIEDGNKNFLADTELINFAKRQKVADITGMIQQYQNQPYCLTVEPKTRAFLESLEPFPDQDEKDVLEYLWNQSLKIEPRASAKIPKFPCRYSELLKKSKRHTSASHSHSDNADDTTSVSQLSPTSAYGCDGSESISLASFQSLQDDEHRASSLISPRSGTFSLLDKSRSGAPVSLSRHSNPATSPSGRDADSTSPRLPEPARLPKYLHHPPNGKWDHDLGFDFRHSFPHDPPPPRHNDEAEVRLQKIVNEIINGDKPSKPPALSPRNPIVDASVFYGTDNAALHHNFGEFGSPKRTVKNAPELFDLRINKPPALSPRNVDRSTKPRCESTTEDDLPPLLPRVTDDVPPLLPRVSDEVPPLLPRVSDEVPPLLPRADDIPPLLPRSDEVPPLLPRSADKVPPPVPRGLIQSSGFSEGMIYGNSEDAGVRVGGRFSPERAPTPPERQPRVTDERPLPSPLLDGVMRFPTMSPKRSPAPLPPHSPLVNVSPGVSRNAFSFPSRAAPTPSPGAPPPLTPHHSCSTPPPLPPRRRRDSTPAPHTPHPPPATCAAPPPLPPRPAPAPAHELLRPQQSTILQRRHHGSAAP